MKTNKKTINKEIKIENYNACPRCGGKQLSIVTKGNSYRVECNRCGIGNSWSTYIADDAEELEVLIRKEWNEHFFSAELTEDALVELDWSGTGFAAARTYDKRVEIFSDQFEDVADCFYVYGNDEACVIYLMIDGVWQQVGGRFLMDLMLEYLSRK